MQVGDPSKVQAKCLARPMPGTGSPKRNNLTAATLMQSLQGKEPQKSQHCCHDRKAQNHTWITASLTLRLILKRVQLT